ncbi:Uncharacterised protein [Raoultella terrigena]|uniref:Outer membrane protein W n=1 Tax=Raoultella terrigena TaxID=577 RepID=A0A4U9D4R1_RAOTE|nr:Uncharacterised protein [Raoultella terrigena]
MKPYLSPVAVLCTLCLSCTYASAEVDLGSIDIFSANNPNSPVPKGFVLGTAAISGTARYEKQDNDTHLIPGGLYFGDRFIYLAIAPATIFISMTRWRPTVMAAGVLVI